MRAAARETLATLEIDLAEKKLGLPVRNLSGGQRQAVAIGRAIFWKAELLIMDEPTAALGVPEQRKVIELIRRLRRRTSPSSSSATTWSTSSPSPTASWSCGAGWQPASAGRKQSSHDEIVRLMVGG